ncbi:CatB-related O-acetyltransferase [Acidocella sp.]|uniref:CatB-related O-acetyltransferase n=1 Tax=Acidocella sp. TaxID=50710 RepID=UPI002601BB49|nr:CatB-related O-acetyltransferase [Acidocella sp.]
MLITAEIRERLLEKGVACLHPRPFILPDNCSFEPPCSLKRMQVAHSLSMGAFSYAESGYFFAARIGRYCSIEENVQIGRGSHPIDWGSSSPLFYGNHQAVFNQEIGAAKGFLVNAKPRTAKITTIGNDVHIGYGALVHQGVTIGDGAIIKPMAVVVKDVPPYAIVEGNPGMVTEMRFPLETAAALQKSAWWRYAFWDLNSSSDEMFWFDDVSSILRRFSDREIFQFNPDIIVLKRMFK